MRSLTDHPGTSNRQVAAALGIRNESQVSRPLSRMRELGWASDDSSSHGSANAWRVTTLGKSELQHARHASGRIHDHNRC